MNPQSGRCLDVTGGGIAVPEPDQRPVGSTSASGVDTFAVLSRQSSQCRQPSRRVLTLQGGRIPKPSLGGGRMLGPFDMRILIQD